jgi:hypothetical protein
MTKTTEPKEVKFPFPNKFRQGVATGQIIASARTKRYGNIFDYFWVPYGDGRTKCVILSIFRMRLWHISYELHQALGFYNFDDWIVYWNKTNSTYPYETYKQATFFVHIFTPSNEWADYQPDFELIKKEIKNTICNVCTTNLKSRNHEVPVE